MNLPAPTKLHTICKPGNFLQPISIVIYLASLTKENNNACHFFESGALFGHCKRHIISDCMQSRSNDRNLILYMSRDGHYQYVCGMIGFPRYIG